MSRTHRRRDPIRRKATYKDTERQVVLRDCPSGKRRFPTKAAVKAAHKQREGALPVTEEKRSKRGSWYRCTLCGGWHMTSIPKGAERSEA